MLTTTRLPARFPRGEGPAHPFGLPTLTATMSPLQPPTKKVRQFWSMNRRIEFESVGDWQESRADRHTAQFSDNAQPYSVSIRLSTSIRLQMRHNHIP